MILAAHTSILHHGDMTDGTPGESNERFTASSLTTRFVVAVPIAVAVIALTMSSVFASDMMTEEEMDIEGQVEATWDYEGEASSGDMEYE